MRKIRFLLLSMLALLSFNGAWGQTEPYTVDFNTAFDTSNHDFAVASHWGHIVPDSDFDGWGPYYMTYSYYNDQGVGGTGTLFASKQYAGDGYSGGETVYDLLVTPTVSGTITLDIKAFNLASSSYNAFVEFYSLNEAGTAKNQLLKTVKTEIPGYNSGNNTSWITATLEVTEAQKIGIRAQNVYIDNFTATSAEIVAQKGLTVTKVANSDGQTGTTGTNPVFEQQADGTLKVVLQLTLNNSGDIDLTAGEDGYTLTLASAQSTSATKTYYEDATIDVPVDIAAGQSATFDATFYIPYSSAAYKYYYVRENVTGTTSSSNRYAGAVAYEPKFVFVLSSTTVGSSTSSLSDAQAYGMVTASVTKTYKIANSGTAPLTVKSITLPAGFTSENAPAGEFTVAPGASQNISITLPATPTGSYSGNLQIVYLDATGAEKTFSLPFSGNVITAGTWYADFNGSKTTSTTGSYPAGSAVTSSTGLQFDCTGSYNAYDQYLKSYTTAGTFVTPKLHAAAGDQLTFDAVKYQTGNSYKLTVYVSTDRVNWGEAKAVISNSTLETSGTRYPQAISFDAEGDYYVAFELNGVGLDNLVGLQKVNVAHDIYFKSVNLPATAKAGTALSPKATIIALTTEAAANYTAKYYVDGEVAATVASTALTASATNTKDFTFSYTPADETTTTHTTYIAFEFTDGTIIKTDEQQLEVLAEATFSFITPTTTVTNWDAPTSVSSAIDFGRTSGENESKVYRIFNWGSAPLKINSIETPDGFSVKVTKGGDDFDISTGTIAIKDSVTVQVVFSATTPGTYSGNIVFNHSGVIINDSRGAQGEANPYTIGVKGIKLDANKWFADFGTESNSFPNGSLVQGNVSGTTPTTGNGTLLSSSDDKNLFITPKLKAAAGEAITFEAKARSSYVTADDPGYVTVYLISDHKAAAETTTNAEFEALNPTLVDSQEILYSTVPDWTSFSVTIPEAGEYYLGFKIKDAYVDNLYGLELVDIGHEWILKDANIPTKAMQNMASSATISLQNIGIKAEEAGSYTVVAYVNGVATETQGATAIPVVNKLTASATAIQAQFKSPKAGTLPVYFEIKADDYSVTTDPVDVTFDEEVASDEKTVGTPSGTDSSTPVNLYYKNSETIALYTQDDLGLSGGEKISSISYKGYSTTTHTSTLKVYYEWTDDKAQAKPTSSAAYDTTGMTEAYSGSYSWKKVGSSSALENLIELNFDTPLVYESGKSLRILVRSTANSWSSSSSAFNFEKSNSTANTYQHQNDGTEAVFTGTWNSKNRPVIHLTLEANPSVATGTVTDIDGNPIEGASVTLLSNDGDGVGYDGTTDAEGNYSISVVQGSRSYDLTASKEGYADAVVEDADLSQPINLVLKAPVAVTISAAGYATLYYENVTLEIPKGVTAYNVSVTDNKIVREAIEDGLVPAGTAVLIAGEAGTYNFGITDEESDNIYDSALTGVEEDTKDTEAGYTYYVLSYNAGKTKVGFYFQSGSNGKWANVKAHQAYLKLTNDQAANITGFDFGDDVVTSLSSFTMDDERDAVDSKAARVYNLAGQLVNDDYKGVVIVNGKKVVRK